MPKTSSLSASIAKTLPWICLPATLWVGIFLLRPLLYHSWCAVLPTPCTVESVNRLDQIVFQFHSIFADFLSNLVQNTLAVTLFLLPVVLVRAPKSLIRLESFLLYGTLWNGVLLELARSFAQRPRPLVMNHVFEDGANINQYTSFYSGHTSFVAYASLATLFWLRAHFGNRHPYSRIAWILCPALVALTATLRVLGGRHFPTDTVAGAVAGSLVAMGMWLFYARDINDSVFAREAAESA